MRRIPNFFALRAFEAAARFESFTLGAEELSLTPSAVSHQIRDLEEYFGVALFVRTKRRVETTPEGRRLYESLARIFDALETCCNDVGLAPRSQVLAVHCAPSLAVKWLGPRLPGFMKTHPNITIRLSSAAEPIDLTRYREVDVAISYAVAREGSGIQVTPLGAERILPLCAPGLVDQTMPAREQIKVLPLIDSQLSRVSWPEWFTFNEIQLPKAPRVSFDRAALAISAAVDGMGVTLESARLAEREIARRELVELGAGIFKELERETHFFSHRIEQGQVDKVATFRRWLLEQAGVDQ